MRPQTLIFPLRYRSQRQRTFTNEDAPPTTSVNDMMNEIYEPSTPRKQQVRRAQSRIIGVLTWSQNFSVDSPARSYLFKSTPAPPATPKPALNVDAPRPLYVIVFGYPQDRYTVTVEYFRSLGETTEPIQDPELINCFRIGYINPPEALRAIRKNGEIMGGAWMIGVKWAVSSTSHIYMCETYTDVL